MRADSCRDLALVFLGARSGVSANAVPPAALLHPPLVWKVFGEGARAPAVYGSRIGPTALRTAAEATLSIAAPATRLNTFLFVRFLYSIPSAPVCEAASLPAGLGSCVSFGAGVSACPFGPHASGEPSGPQDWLGSCALPPPAEGAWAPPAPPLGAHASGEAGSELQFFSAPCPRSPADGVWVSPLGAHAPGEAWSEVQFWSVSPVRVHVGPQKRQKPTSPTRSQIRDCGRGSGTLRIKPVFESNEIRCAILYLLRLQFVVPYSLFGA